MGRIGYRPIGKEAPLTVDGRIDGRVGVGEGIGLGIDGDIDGGVDRGIVMYLTHMLTLFPRYILLSFIFALYRFGYE